ncbi:hypothetical protein D9M71_335200 [compost metagenome]
MAVAVAGDFGEEVGQAHVTGDDQALGPGAAVHVRLLCQARAVGVDLVALPGLGDGRAATKAEWRYGYRTLADAQAGGTAVLTHHEARAECLEQPVAAAYAQRTMSIAGSADENFAALQHEQALALVEAHVHRAVGIQLQLAAVGQHDAAALADAGAVIGHQPLPGRDVAAQPQRRAADQYGRQQLQRLPAAQALAGVFQGIQRHAGGGYGVEAGLQFLVQAIDPLPGQFVIAMGGAPVFAGGVQFGGGIVLQAQHPLDGLLDHPRFRRRAVHSA